MKFIFCSEPFSPNEPDYVYKNEAETVSQLSFKYELFSFEDLTENKIFNAFKKIKPQENPETAIYRGWMLKPEQYEILYNELKSRNLLLINSPNEYKNCHYFPESYEIITDSTPKSIYFEINKAIDFDEIMNKLSVFGNKSLILKDFVKSRKHEWKEACFISNASDRNAVEKVIKRFVELQGEDLNKGLVFREFLELQPLQDHSKSGMPLTKEFRFFFLNKKLIFTSEYWEEGIYRKEDFPKDLFLEVAENIQSNFFTMDVAQKTDGEWIIIELGDAQVAGLPETANVLDFYKQFTK